LEKKKGEKLDFFLGVEEQYNRQSNGTPNKVSRRSWGGRPNKKGNGSWLKRVEGDQPLKNPHPWEGDKVQSA